MTQPNRIQSAANTSAKSSVRAEKRTRKARQLADGIRTLLCHLEIPRRQYAVARMANGLLRELLEEVTASPSAI